MSEDFSVKPKVVLVYGGPGAGKGTQCANVERELNYAHISVGDLLRREWQKAGSEYAEGTIVAEEITCELIEAAMEKSQSNKFVIEGYPLNKDNLEGWYEFMQNKVDLLFVIFLDCSKSNCVERCLLRGDANEVIILNRLRMFYSETLLVLEHFGGMGYIEMINANKSIQEIFQNIKDLFGTIE